MRRRVPLSSPWDDNGGVNGLSRIAAITAMIAVSCSRSTEELREAAADAAIEGPAHGVTLYFAPDTDGDLDAADTVILFGSWAARYLGRPGRTPNDIVVLVIGDVDHDAAEVAEQRIGLPVEATARSRKSWMNAQESFIREVKSRPLVPVLIDVAADRLADELHTLREDRQSG